MSEADIFRKQVLKVSQIMEMPNVSINWVMKWSVRGETGEFSEVVFAGSHFNNSKSEGDLKRCHDCIMMSS